MGLEQGGLVGTSVNVDQGVAFADELAFFVMDSGDDAVDLAGDRSGVNRSDGADGIEVDADVALLGGCGDEADGPAATSRGFCRGRGGVALAQDEIKSAGEYQEDNNPHEDADTFVPGGSIGSLVLRSRGRAGIVISRQVSNPLSRLCDGPWQESPYSIDEICGFLDTVVSVDPGAGSINQVRAASLLYVSCGTIKL